MKFPAKEILSENRATLLFITAVLVLLTLAAIPISAGTSPDPMWDFGTLPDPAADYLGSFQINYRYNASGCAVPIFEANPFYCSSIISDGIGYTYPIVLDLTPGWYGLDFGNFSNGGGNPRAFVGTPSGGSIQCLNSDNCGTLPPCDVMFQDCTYVEFYVARNQNLVLFQHDWHVGPPPDNPSDIWVQVSLTGNCGGPQSCTVFQEPPRFTPAGMPEPPSMSLFITGIGALLCFRLRLNK